MSIRLMHLADLHLGAPLTYLGDRAAQRSRELVSAFERALALTREREVHAVLIAGDLFDSFDPPSELVAQVKAALHGTIDGGIPVILIPGTHDSHRYARCVYRREEFSGVDILFDVGKPVHKNLNGHEAHFYGYPGSGRRSEEHSSFHREEMDGIHIALVHGTVSEGTHWSTSPRDYSLQPEEVEESRFDYVALGHHHSFKEYRYGTVTAAYPGTLEGLKYGEHGDRHLLIVEIDGKRTILEKVKHNLRTLSEIHIDLSLSGIETSEELATAIEKHADPDGIVKIVLSGAANFLPPKRELESRFENLFFHIEIADDTTVYESEFVRSIIKEDTVRGIFARKMLERLDQCEGENRRATELALRLGVMQLLRASDENQKHID